MSRLRRSTWGEHSCMQMLSSVKISRLGFAHVTSEGKV